MTKGHSRMVKEKTLLELSVKKNVAWLPLKDVYLQVKEKAGNIDVVQKFRNNVMYGKYNIETIDTIRCVNTKNPMKEQNCSVILSFKEDDE